MIDELITEPFDPDYFVDKQFKNFNMNELVNHQQAILNVFHQFNSHAQCLMQN